MNTFEAEWWTRKRFGSTSVGSPRYPTRPTWELHNVDIPNVILSSRRCQSLRKWRWPRGSLKIDMIATAFLVINWGGVEGCQKSLETD